MVGDWIKNLCRGIEISDQNFEPYRRRRAEYLRHYQHAVGDDAANVLPLNIVAWTVNVMLPHLMYRHVIEAMIEARDPWKQPEADWLS